MSPIEGWGTEKSIGQAFRIVPAPVLVWSMLGSGVLMVSGEVL
jgi:hypothetical protein